MTAAEFDSSALGVWTDPEHFDVTAERIAEYAAATNDPIEQHRSGAVAPPVFAVVPAFPSLVPAALSVAPVELIMKLVHGEQDFHFHRPIVAGDRLTIRSRAIGFASLSTGSTVTIHAETRDAEGNPVNDQYMSAFFRRVDAGGSVGEHAPAHSFDAALHANSPAVVSRQRIDEDQTFRYSPAAGDPMPIHLDDELARMAGLPGIINHGLCTMAFTSWALLTELADGDVSRLARFAVRFAKPVLPAQEIETSFWSSGDGSYSFETSVDGERVIRDGLAVITSI